jgi:hypothetical protein
MSDPIDLLRIQPGLIGPVEALLPFIRHVGSATGDAIRKVEVALGDLRKHAEATAASIDAQIASEPAGEALASLRDARTELHETLQKLSNMATELAVAKASLLAPPNGRNQ